jgi:hypothetical protein
MRAVLVAIVLALAGCSSESGSAPEITLETARPEARPLPHPGKDGEIGAPSAAPGDWEAGALRTAEFLGCKRPVWQLPGETFAQAAAIYSRGYVRGDCLILVPHHGGANYFLGYAGQFDGCECGPLVSAWPGVPVYYLRDIPEPEFI